MPRGKKIVPPTPAPVCATTCPATTHWQGFVAFSKSAMSENGFPSSARLVSACLALASMLLISWVLFHVMYQTADKLTIWLPNLPLLIGALAAFSTSPYAVSKIAAVFDKKEDKDKTD